MEAFRTLKVWQKSHQLTLDVYRLTKTFPREELCGLTSQIRRASVSVEANIAEGSKRRTAKDRRHFLTMSDTSLEEVKCYFLLARDLGFASAQTCDKLLEQAREVGKMLIGLMRSQKLMPERLELKAEA